MPGKKSVSRLFSVLCVMVFMLAISPLQAAHAADVLYAKPTAVGTGDCSSWDNACTLQTALSSAASGNEIWAATGTYLPTTGTERTATFQLKNGVAVYGGFAGTETVRSDRNPTANPTTLSGDIGASGDASDNSYHVVIGANGVTLDGFTISGGNGNGTAPNERGAGLYNVNCSPTLTNVTISGNSAVFGGGVFNDTSSPTLTDVTFSGNTATSSGGGMYSSHNSPTLTDVTFTNNSAQVGGGMENDNSNPVLTGGAFNGNKATTNGGGMYNGGDSGSSPAVTNVNFINNSADSGGGIYNYSGEMTVTNSTLSGNAGVGGSGGITNKGTLTVTSSTLSGNSTGTSGSGGGIGNSGTLTVTNSTLSGNNAGAWGGGIFNSSTLMVANSTLSGNYAGMIGGGIGNLLGGTLTVKNSTLSGNSSAFMGGGINNNNNSHLYLYNTIIANSADSGDCTNSGTINGNTNNLVGDGSCSAGGIHFKSGDPLLSGLANNGGLTWTMALGAGSPAIDAGDDTTCAASPVNNLDQRGVTRPQGAHCDIGAFELGGGGPTNTPTSTPTRTATPTATPTFTPTTTNTPASPPPNDDFDSATTINAVPFSTSEDITAATSAADDPLMDCQSIRFTWRQSVWFRFTPPGSGQLSASTAGSDHDTIMEVWSGTRGSLVGKACDSSSGTTGASLTTYVDGGILYYIEVASFQVQDGTLHLSVGFSPTTPSSPPPNDDFDSATTISAVPYTISEDINLASRAADDPLLPCTFSDNNNLFQSVWFRYTPPSDGRLSANTVGNKYETTLAVWTGTRGSLTNVDCEDGFGTSSLIINVTGGTVYYLEVASYQGGVGTLQFSLGFSPPGSPPPNDDFDSATTINAVPYTTSENVIPATTADDDPTLGCIDDTGGQSVWFRYTPPTDGLLSANTTGSNYDTVLAVWTGTRGSLTGVACNNDVTDIDATSRLSANVKGGTDYYIEVVGYGIGIELQFALDFTPIPPNDDFDSATTINAVPYTTSENVISATTADDDPTLDCMYDTGYQSVWFRYTPPSDGLISANTTGSSYDTVLEVWKGTRGSLTGVACNNDASGDDSTSLLNTNVKGGTAYYIEVVSWEGGGSTLQFSLDFIPTPPNDDFDSATTINAVPYGTSENIISATYADDDPTLDCLGDTGSQSVWFHYTPPADGWLSANTTGSNYNTVLAVWTGSRGSLTEVACNDDATDNAVTSWLNTNVKGGTAYYIEVVSYGIGNMLQFSLDFSSAGTFTPTNTPTQTPIVTPTSTPTNTSIAIFTRTYTPTRTSTPTSTSTSTPTNTPTRTSTPTSTSTSTPTNTPTRTSTPSSTSTYTPTKTATPAVNKIYLPVIVRDQAQVQAVNPAVSLQSWLQQLLARLFNQHQLLSMDAGSHTGQ